MRALAQTTALGAVLAVAGSVAGALGVVGALVFLLTADKILRS